MSIRINPSSFEYRVGLAVISTLISSFSQGSYFFVSILSVVLYSTLFFSLPILFTIQFREHEDGDVRLVANTMYTLILYRLTFTIIVGAALSYIASGAVFTYIAPMVPSIKGFALTVIYYLTLYTASIYGGWYMLLAVFKEEATMDKIIAEGKYDKFLEAVNEG